MATYDNQIALWAKIYNDSFVNESKYDNEDDIEEAMSIDDILATGNSFTKKYTDEQKRIADEKAKNMLVYKTIWVKTLHIDSDENKSRAQLQITYTNGKVEDVDEYIGTTGKDAHHLIDKDQMYTQVKSQIPTFVAKGVKRNEEDVRLAILRISFQNYNGQKIEWLYGPEKKTDSVWAFSRNATELQRSFIQKKLLGIRAGKAQSGLTPKTTSRSTATTTNDYHDSSKYRMTYDNFNSKIYKPIK